MQNSTSKTIAAVAATILLMGASAAANAHSANHQTALHSHKHAIPTSNLAIVAHLPSNNVLVVIGGQNYYVASGQYYVRHNHGWRMVAAPARARAAATNKKHRRAVHKRRFH